MRIVISAFILFLHTIGTLFSAGAEFMLIRKGRGFDIAVDSLENSRFLEQRALANPALLLMQLREQKICQGEESFRQTIYDHPGTLLDECTREDCCLNRLDHPEVRRKARERVIASVQENFPDTSAQISIASFGSGDLFQDFVICTHLKNLGYENICIDLIDTGWQSIVSFFAQGNFKNDDMIPASFDFLDTERYFGHNAMAGKLAQLIQFRRLLPKGWSVQIYASVKDLNKSRYDCILGIDYGELEYLQKTPLDFDNLLLSGLKPGGIAFDFNSKIECGHLCFYRCKDFVPAQAGSLYRQLRLSQAKMSLNILASIQKTGEYSSSTAKNLSDECNKAHSQLKLLQDGDYVEMNPLKPWLSRELISINWDG